MAKDAVVELQEEGVVTVDVSGDADLAAAADELGGDEAVTTKEKPVAVQRVSKPSAADEAAAALTQAVRAREAAEATALAERQQRDAALRTLAERDQETTELRETAAAAELAKITTGIEAAGREVDVLTAELERAAEAGDFKAQATANAKLAQVAARKDRLEAEKVSFESGATRKAAPSTEGRVVNQPAAPFERYVAGFPPKAQAWLRAHPDYVPAEVGGNATKNASMMAGHFDALASGLTEGSDQYFQHIEEKIGVREPVSKAAEVVLAGDTERKPVVQQPRRPAPSAPPSRDSEPTGAQQRSVRLTPAQQEIALLSASQKPGETEQAFKARAFGSYATELVKAQAAGQIGRMTH